MERGDEIGKQETEQYGNDCRTGAVQLSLECLVDKEDWRCEQECLQESETKQSCAAQQQIPCAANYARQVIVEVVCHSLRVTEDVLVERVGKAHVGIVYSLQAKQHSVEKACEEGEGYVKTVFLCDCIHCSLDILLILLLSCNNPQVIIRYISYYISFLYIIWIIIFNL